MMLKDGFVISCICNLSWFTEGELVGIAEKMGIFSMSTYQRYMVELGMLKERISDNFALWISGMFVSGLIEEQADALLALNKKFFTKKKEPLF